MTKLIERNTTIPTQEVADLHDGRRRSDLGRHPRAPRRARDGARTTRRSDASASKASRPAPRGVPQIEVTFNIDANGIVNVGAKDLGTGKEQQITITASTNLTKDEVDRMVRDAEAAGCGRQGASAKRPKFATTRFEPDLLDREVAQGSRRQARRGARGEVESALDELKRVSENGTAAEIKAGDREAASRPATRWPSALQDDSARTVKLPTSNGAAPVRTARASGARHAGRRPTTSSTPSSKKPSKATIGPA